MPSILSQKTNPTRILDASLESGEECGTLRELVHETTGRLKKADILTARLDAEVLCMAALGIEKSALYTRWNERVSPSEKLKVQGLLKRRLAREPLQYIVGETEFWSENFILSPDVLIPRPETEMILESVFSFYGDSSPERIVDLGTGSGVLAILLAREYPKAKVWAVDISLPALRVARLNAQRHGVKERISFLCGDLWEPVKREGILFDLVVSNLPYLSAEEMINLVPEVQYEPQRALSGGGEEGLDIIRRAIVELPRFASERCFVAFEIGKQGGGSVKKLFEKSLSAQVSILRDGFGDERIVLARKL